MTIPQSFATDKNRSSLPTKVRHIADAREYLLTFVASTVSRRIYIYIRELKSLEIVSTIKRFVDHIWNYCSRFQRGILPMTSAQQDAQE